jgi:hypothetical protein
MSVVFSEVVIRNNNNIDVEFTIEAPAGSVVTRRTIQGQTEESIRINRNDCPSLSIVAQDSAHSAIRQTFDIRSAMGPPACLESAEVLYSIGTFRARFKANTG